MVDKVENIEKGDLVELVLTPDATWFLGAHTYLKKDPMREVNIPGRSFVGYVIKIDDSKSISLANGWDKVKNRPLDGEEGYVYMFEVIDSYSKR